MVVVVAALLMPTVVVVLTLSLRPLWPGPLPPQKVSSLVDVQHALPAVLLIATQGSFCKTDDQVINIIESSQANIL